MNQLEKAKSWDNIVEMYDEDLLITGWHLNGESLHFSSLIEDSSVSLGVPTVFDMAGFGESPNWHDIYGNTRGEPFCFLGSVLTASQGRERLFKYTLRMACAEVYRFAKLKKRSNEWADKAMAELCAAEYGQYVDMSPYQFMRVPEWEAAR